MRGKGRSRETGWRMAMGQSARLGYSLVEALIVIVVLGAIALVVVQQSTRADPARALALYQTAGKMAQAWETIARDCGASTDTALKQIGADPMAVLAGGAANVNADLRNCVQSGIIRPLSEEVSQDGGGNYQVQNYPATFSGGGTTPYVIEYADVSPEVTAALVGRFSAHQVTYPIDSDPQLATDAKVRAFPDGRGTYRVQVIFPGGTAAVAAAVGTNPAAAASPVPVMIASVTPPSSSTTTGGVAPPSLPPPPAAPGGGGGGGSGTSSGSSTTTTSSSTSSSGGTSCSGNSCTSSSGGGGGGSTTSGGGATSTGSSSGGGSTSGGSSGGGGGGQYGSVGAGCGGTSISTPACYASAPSGTLSLAGINSFATGLTCTSGCAGTTFTLQDNYNCDGYPGVYAQDTATSGNGLTSITSYGCGAAIYLSTAKPKSGTTDPTSPSQYLQSCENAAAAFYGPTDFSTWQVTVTTYLRSVAQSGGNWLAEMHYTVVDLKYSDFTTGKAAVCVSSEASPT